MIHKLILSQGDLGHQMLAAAQKIAGEMPEFAALDLDWNDSLETAERKIADKLEELALAEDGSILILTDIFGGTPHNIAVTFCRPGQVETVTGVNLPMVVRLGCCSNREMSLHELAAWIQRKGRRSIQTSQGGPEGGRRGARS